MRAHSAMGRLICCRSFTGGTSVWKIREVGGMAETSQTGDHDESRRDFLVMAAGAMGAVGVGSFAWPLIDQMNPSADVLALAST